MKVLIASDFYPPESIGGIQTAVFTLSTFLAKSGVEVVIVTGGKEAKVEKNDNLIVYRLKEFKIPFYPLPIVNPSTKKIKEIFDTEKPDVVHVEVAMMLGNTCMNIAKKRGIPVVYTNHALPENANQLLPQVKTFSKIFSWSFWKVIKKFATRADCVTSPSYFGLTQLTSRFTLKKTQVISNGLDLSRYKRNTSRTDAEKKLKLTDKKIILYVGRLYHEKSPDVIVKASKMVIDKNPKAYFVLIGEGPQKQMLKALSEELGVSDRLIFLGHLDEETLKLYYEAATIFMTASTQELQGISVMEAMSFGLPVVSVNAKALPELVHNKENGFLFDPFKSVMAGERVLKILEDEKLQKTMGEKSLEFIKEHDVYNTIKQYKELYERLIAEKTSQ